MALKLLIADPDHDWSQETQNYFEQHQYVVETSFNGRETQLKLYRDKYFALILNWSLKNHSAKQVLAFVKKNHPQLKVILLVDEATLSADELEESFDKLGVSEVLKKPYDRDQIRKGLEGQQDALSLANTRPQKEGLSDEVEMDGPDEQYTAIKIEEFFSSKAVLFDVFVRLRANRYVKILHAGDTFSRERIQKYQIDKGVEYLYFHNQDRKKFIQFNNLIAKKSIEANKVASQTKVNLVKNVTSQYIEDVYVEGLKPQVVEQGKEICETVYQLVEKDKDLYKFLRDFQAFDPTAYSHSFLVTLYSTSITQQFDWQSAQTLQSLALACLLHDIGKTQLPQGLNLKRPAEMNEEELELYHQHPEMGYELVKDNKMINNTVKQIIIQHHEAYDGSGYPRQLTGAKILMMANILCLVDDFIHKMVLENSSPIETLKKILSDKEQVRRYHSDILQNFIKVFVDPSKLAKDKKAA